MSQLKKILSRWLFLSNTSSILSTPWLYFFIHFPQQEGTYEADAELEGEVEDECEAEVCEELEEVEEADEDLAVIVEEVPTASRLDEQGYSAQVVVYGDEAYVMQEVETEGEGGGMLTFLRSV